MKTTYFRVVAGVFLLLPGINFAFAQSGPEFLNCPSAPISLCVNDPGVRLPANNQIYSSEADTNATSCSVHVTESIRVKSNCGHHLQYGVQLFLGDTSAAITLQALKTISTDSLDEGELNYDSELSPVNFIHENGIPYNSGCVPYHRIKWIAIDSCGNINECEELINLYDCQAPIDTTQIPLSIITLPIGGQITVHAKDFVRNIIDDCTAFDDLLFSFRPEEYMPNKTYSCNIPAFGVEIPSTLWVADKGRDINCDGIISWNERNVYPYAYKVLFYDSAGTDCDSAWANQISGKIYTEDFQPVEMVSMNLSIPGQLFPTFITTNNGEYNFNYIAFPAHIKISAERDDNHRNGVSTLDLVKIQKHLLGKEIITSPYKLIAADANNSQSASAIDLVELRKLILGVYTRLPNNKSWRFFAKNSMVQDTTHPWPFKETIDMTINGSVSDEDFIAIKIGDVNNSVQANAQALVPREAYQPVALTIAPRKFETNEIVNIDFSINDLKSLNGFQFTLSDPDLEFLSATSNIIDLSEENYALFNNKMTMSWFTTEENAIDPSQIVFTIKAIAKNAGSLEQSLQLNSDITAAELYSANDETFIPKILVKSNDEDQLILMAPEPNPWSTTCTIPFHMQKNGNLVFTVYDMNGEKVFSEEKYYSTGYHEMELNVSDLHTNGLLFYTLQTENETRSGKMILLK